MGKWRVYAGVLVLGLGVAVLVYCMFSSHEPAYEGRSLSEWVGRYSPGQYTITRAQVEETDAAVRHMGADAVPFLMTWIRYERPGMWKRRLYHILEHVTGGRSRKWMISDVERAARAMNATYALRALGPQAAGAARELTRLLNDEKRYNTAMRAANALGGIGNAGVLPLVSVLTNEQSSEEFTAVAAFHLESMGTNAVGALQALLTNDEPAVRRLARNALLKIDPEALNRR